MILGEYGLLREGGPLHRYYLGDLAPFRKIKYVGQYTLMIDANGIPRLKYHSGYGTDEYVVELYSITGKISEDVHKFYSSLGMYVSTTSTLDNNKLAPFNFYQDYKTSRYSMIRCTDYIEWLKNAKEKGI